MCQVWVPPSLCEGGCGVRSTVSGESVSQGAATPRGLPGSRTRFHIPSACGVRVWLSLLQPFAA